jgi:hypothetical protein
MMIKNFLKLMELQHQLLKLIQVKFLIMKKNMKQMKKFQKINQKFHKMMMFQKNQQLQLLFLVRKNHHQSQSLKKMKKMKKKMMKKKNKEFINVIVNKEELQFISQSHLEKLMEVLLVRNSINFSLFNVLLMILSKSIAVANSYSTGKGKQKYRFLKKKCFRQKFNFN